MTKDDALAFGRDTLMLLEEERDVEARELFNSEYPELRPLLQTGEPFHLMWQLFFDLDRYLNDPDTARMASITPGYLRSQYEDTVANVLNGSD